MAGGGGEAEAFEAVADASQIGEGELLGAEVGGRQVVLGRVGGELYAIGGVCTHQQAPLAEGALDGEVLVCPWHNSGFDIRTGRAVRPPAMEPVPHYAVRVEGGTVLVSREPLG
jgi:nitrite reductase/ring-hydroxylating ferredoxin subunit